MIVLLSFVSLVLGSPLRPRLDDGLALTPQMGWNSYNEYNCFPNEAVIKSNADALVESGLADLGYRYVTTDCGWTVADRLANGSLTWNETLFPSGFPALGRYLHDRDLLFGVYQDSGILLCGSPPDNVGSLYYESIDAKTFEEWEVDSLKYDNCYSDSATNYPNVNYEPSISPAPRFANMSTYLQALSRPILYQICEWGIDFPALWAPEIGHSWRIGNDIIPHWRAIFRTLNQAAPQTSFAGPGQWPDLDMLMIGLGVLSTAEEETHFSLWGILKSPLVIGGDVGRMSDEARMVLGNEDVIGFNQDGLGVSATLVRRWSDEGVELWAGPLEGGRMVGAMVNWREEEREVSLDLPDMGVQYAGALKNVWRGEEEKGVKTRYTAVVAGHGTMLVELSDIVPAGTYPAEIFAEETDAGAVFSSIYAHTTSANHHLTISFANPPSHATNITVTSGTSKPITAILNPSSRNLTLAVPLSAGPSNTLTIHPSLSISSIHITPPNGTYYSATSPTFTLTGSASPSTCDPGFCLPIGSKIGYLGSNSTALATIPSTTLNSASESEAKYIEIDYINNDVAFSTSWDWGSNSRNLTIRVNGLEPVRLEVPLSGKHSELFGPGKGWWDTATLGVLLEGWKEGENEVVFGNEVEGGFTDLGPDLVGVRVFH